MLTAVVAENFLGGGRLLRRNGTRCWASRPNTGSLAGWKRKSCPISDGWGPFYYDEFVGEGYKLF